MTDQGQFVKFVPPLIVLLFAATMSGVWTLDTKRRHLLFFGLSFGCFAMGLLVPISLISDSLALTSPIATALHFMGGWLLCEGVMMRMGMRYSRVAPRLIGLGLLAAMAFFIANDTGYARIAPAVHLSLGSLMAVLCIQARDLAYRSSIDRVLFGALLLLTVHFYVQAGMALGLPDEIVQPSELIHTRYWQGVMIFGSFAGVFAGLVLLAVTTSDVVEELQAERDTDPLTGVLNRRGLERRARMRLAEVQRGDHGVIIADIDHFKSINDALGHATGDQVLVEFARILQTIAAETTIVGRIGGEEFVLLVRGDAETCERLGNLLCGRVARHQFLMLSGRQLTCSFGIAMVRGGETLWETAARADLALMRVKHRGRNRVAVEGLEFPSAKQGALLLTG
ncbi:diguanylate cyclase (GGDEF)-like protein [Ochrobactrum sp. RC6B]|nr:diguanylate cyclase (GGDEF)-like protein [Ochrobactrum sp. RC6B]